MDDVLSSFELVIGFVSLVIGSDVVEVGAVKGAGIVGDLALVTVGVANFVVDADEVLVLELVEVLGNEEDSGEVMDPRGSGLIVRVVVDGVLPTAFVEVTLVAAVSRSLILACLTKTPWFGWQLKYWTPWTVPLFLPSGSSKTTPIHVSGANCVCPTKATVPGFP